MTTKTTPKTKTKHDWPKILRLALKAKKQNPKLSVTEFFRTQGFKTKAQIRQAHTAVGQDISIKWTQIQDKVTDDVIDKLSLDLASETVEQFRIMEKLFKKTALSLSKTTIKRPCDKIKLLADSASAMRDNIKIMTGGKAVVTPSAKKLVIDWVPIVKYNKPESKSIKKPAPKTKSKAKKKSSTKSKNKK